MQTVLGIEIIRQEYYCMFKTNDLHKNRLQSNNHAYCWARSRETYLSYGKAAQEICHLAKKSRSADQTSHLQKLKYHWYIDTFESICTNSTQINPSKKQLEKRQTSNQHLSQLLTRVVIIHCSIQAVLVIMHMAKQWKTKKCS
jgi:hypothetical protein